MNLALFDFDGTITVKDSFAPFVSSTVERRRARVGYVLLLPTFIGYKLGLVSASVTRARMCAVAFRGRREADVREAGSKYARDVLPTTLRKKAIDRIAWHKGHGDTVVVVSAALNVYLEPWCRAMDVDLVCTQLEAIDGVLTGRYLGGDCVGTEKARRVTERYRLSDFSSVYAYGDTIEDEAMLGLAQRRFFRWRETALPITRRRKADHVDESRHAER